MNNNKLIIAAAGSGKTTRLIKEALEIKDKKVLITTYTQANEEEIRKKFYEINKGIPANITVQTWFSFLLQHGVRPFQGTLNDILFEKKVKGLCMVNTQSGLHYYRARCQDCKQNRIVNPSCKKCKKPTYYGENNDFEKYYFTREMRIFSDKLSKCVVKCNEKSNGAVIERISKIYQHIFIDEVQDLAGYDLELIKLFFNCKSEITLVGDPRQVVYETHNERKYKKYINGKIKEFIQEECKKDCCDFIDLAESYRCKQEICDFADKLYPNLPKTTSKNGDSETHSGIFFVKEQYVETYLQQYKPMQLRYSVTAKGINEKFPVKNFGDSKGITVNRVLIYPTNDMKKWIFDNNQTLEKEGTKAKFYVAITRAKYSVGIVVDNNERQQIGKANYFSP
jgi:superfamily I DNA/RNA helicase